VYLFELKYCEADAIAQRSSLLYPPLTIAFFNPGYMECRECALIRCIIKLKTFPAN
jgi:hypothetical protein